jgi:hypothetical protein
MMRLHIRACQVMMEIIVLLENGFADGAMARWRTLHEIATVAAFIQEHGPDTAKRYVMYQIVESKKALMAYQNCHHELGFKAPSKRVIAKVTKQHEKVLKEYGKPFGEENGWTANILSKSERDHITFERIENAVSMKEMRATYKMASYNVHASPKGAYFRLGQLGKGAAPIAGASNAGLIEPAQNAAVTFSRLCLLLCGEQKTFDEIVCAQIVTWLMFDIPPEFKKADDQLQRDDEKYRPKASRRRSPTLAAKRP